MKRFFSSKVSRGLRISKWLFLIDIYPLVPIIDIWLIRGVAYELIMDTLNFSYSKIKWPVSYDVPLFEIRLGK